jgi:DNA-binding transcriptional MerR regulator
VRPLTSARDEVTIDELAAAVGTTTRRIRSFQTLGLVPHPTLRGRTGMYGEVHRTRLAAVLRLQDQGFSLESVGVLLRAHEAGDSLADVLGIARPVGRGAVRAEGLRADSDADAAELYGFAELQGHVGSRPFREVAGRPMLSVVPTTVWDESEAS